MKAVPLLSVLLLVLAQAAFAAGPVIEVEDPWARESPPMVTNGAAYMTLVNRGDETDRLMSVSGEVAETIELHAHLMEGTVMKMRKIQGIEVNPGEPAILQPGGTHVMLIGLKAPLVKGSSFPLTLHFEKAGDIPVQVAVRRPGTPSP